MKSAFQVKEVKDLTTQKMTYKDYLSLLKKDLDNLSKEPVEFCSAEKFDFSDKKEDILIFGESKDVKEWHKTLNVKKYLSGTCQIDENQKDTILITGDKGSNDAIIKQLSEIVSKFGFKVVAKVAAKDVKKESPEELVKQCSFYMKELDVMIKYKNVDVTPLVLAKKDDKDDVKQLKENLHAKLQKAYKFFVEQLERLGNSEGMPEKNIDALEDKYASSWSDVLKLIKAVEKKLNGGSKLKYNAIKYHNTSESNITKYDNEGHLKDLATGDLNDRHAKMGSLLNKPLHQHLDGGSKGMAFFYKEEKDKSITPIVYDFAASRNGNKYQWANGGQLSGPPKIPTDI